MEDHYHTLQVDPDAESEVIEAAYKRLARKYHPDADPSEGSTRRMQAINAAYDVLSDAARRAEYDRSRRTTRKPGIRDVREEAARAAEKTRQDEERRRKERQESEIEKQRARDAERMRAETLRERKQRDKRVIKWIAASIGGLFVVLIVLGLFLLRGMTGPGRNVRTPNGGRAIIDELNGETTGQPSGIGYAAALSGKAAIFTQKDASRIEYADLIPSEGTLEWWVRIDRSYEYKDFHVADKPSALLFTTTGPDVWFPGSTWVCVGRSGDITLSIATTKGVGEKQDLIVRNTRFRFGEWHSLGISYGARGQFIMLDGVLVGSNEKNTQPLAAGGGHFLASDLPTIGEMRSTFWQPRQFAEGFEGSVDRFRISENQLDWTFSNTEPR